MPGGGCLQGGEALAGEVGEGPPPVDGARDPLDPARPLQAGHGVAEPARRRTGEIGQVVHPDGAVGSLGQSNEDLVVGDRDAGLLLRLTFEGELVTGENLLDSTVTATVDLRSIDTNNEQRDDHIRSTDLFDVETHPAMTFRSTGVSADGDGFIVEGDLSLHGVTRRVPLHLEVNGFGKDPYGGTRAGFSATTELNRKDFGIDTNIPLDGGGVVIGDKIQVSLEVEAILQNPEA
jgi:polyisoprenoid-binding protein YceI